MQELVQEKGQDWFNQNRAKLEGYWQLHEEQGLTLTDAQFLRGHPELAPQTGTQPSCELAG